MFQTNHSYTGTVAAISTPNAAGGIGIVKISGPQAFAVADRVFRAANGRALAGVPGYHAVFGHVYEAASGQPAPAPGQETPDPGQTPSASAPTLPTEIDQCIAVVYRAPKSYTGEDVVELQCHGGLTVMQLVLRAVLAAGAEPAGPGEFTKRAFLNGKLDLSQAESVMDMVSACGDQAANAACHALGGSLRRKVDAAASVLVAASAHMAAWADYPDEDVEALDYDVLLKQFTAVREQLQSLVSHYDAGQAVTAGVDTVIVGRPNVGKSTLMNLMLGKDRSIVTSVAGTTRDVIEETTRIGNVVLRLSDTAGLHDSDDPVESIGIALAQDKLKHADLIIAVFDGNEPLNGEDMQILDACKGTRSIAVINKSDLGNLVSQKEVQPYVSECLTISAKNPSASEALKTVLERLLGTADFDPGAAMLANERQLRCVRASLDGLNEAIAAIETGLTMDAVNVSVDAALSPLLELTGKKVSDTVIEEVFSKFCVGK